MPAGDGFAVCGFRGNVVDLAYDEQNVEKVVALVGMPTSSSSRHRFSTRTLISPPKDGI